jgi:hypothetical protein
VRKTLSAFHLALSAFCVFSLFALPALGQDRDGDRDIEKGEAVEHPNGIVQDWSRRHVVYPRLGPLEGLIAVQRDHRALLSWQEESRLDWLRARHPHRTLTAQPEFHRDWAISLGTGSTAASMFPAKFGLDVNATASCPNDFIVYPVNAAGSATQPNIVAFNNLYSGGSKAITGNTVTASTTVTITGGAVVTASDIGQPISGVGIPGGDKIATVTGNPGTSLTLTVAATATGGTAITVGTGTAGFCNGRAPQGAADNPLLATTLWSYNINAVGGKVATSPGLSMDGTKIAFVETAAGAAHFHVLAPKSGDGVDATSAQNVLLPKTISSFDALAPAAGSGAVTDLALGAASDTLSSPFVDFNTDKAYVGNDAGVLFRVQNVFCTLPACTGGGSPAPSLDGTWGVAGALTIGGSCTGVSGKLTGAVVDSGTGNIFVGCADGKLYGFTSGGVAIAGSPLTVGVGSATGGVVDPPMIDAVNKFVYVVSGSNGGSSVLFQAKTSSFTVPAPVKATLGAGALFSLHAPAFNNAYFNSGVSGNWLILDWAVNASNQVEVYGVSFGGAHAMNSGAAANHFAVVGSTGNELSPVTEFLNGATEQLFVSGLSATNPNIVELNLHPFVTAFPPIDGSNVDGATTAEGSGTSGMVVDNNSASVQASSIYFGVLAPGTNANSAVKLTQSGLL